MAGNVAELTLILKAQNLATGALNEVKTSLGGIGVTGKQVAKDMASAFKGMGYLIASELANLGADILAGKDIKGDMIGLGVTLAGTIVYGLSITFVPAVIKVIAGIPAVKGLITAVTAAGTSIGGTLGSLTAASFGTAAAIGLAIVLPILAVQIGKGFADALPPWLKGQGGLGMSESQTRILNARYQHDRPEKMAEGGWVGLHGPQLVMAGERGPEFVRKAGTGTGDNGGEGFRIMGVSEKQIIDMVDRGLYFKLQRSSVGLAKS